MYAWHSLLISPFHVKAIKQDMAECKGNTLCLEESYVMTQMAKLADLNREIHYLCADRTLKEG